MNHRADFRRVKQHRPYTIDELARTIGVHKNTVRHWIKNGLPTADRRRPTLILGSEVKRFHNAIRTARKHPCGPGELFCFKCRTPRAPAFDALDYIPITDTSGNLRGLCPECGTLMHKRASLMKLDSVGASLDIQFPHGKSRLTETMTTTGNDDFGKDR